MDDEKNKKSFVDYFKSGFKPASERADEEVEANRKEIGGSQWNQDMKLSAIDRRAKILKGFYNR